MGKTLGRYVCVILNARHEFVVESFVTGDDAAAVTWADQAQGIQQA
jgi:hypothetical protein